MICIRIVRDLQLVEVLELDHPVRFVVDHHGDNLTIMELVPTDCPASFHYHLCMDKGAVA